MHPLRLIFAGGGEFGLPTLQALLGAGHQIALVVTQPDRPAGRGRAMTPTPVAAAALRLSLPLLRTEDINRETLPADADALVVIAFGQKVADRVVRRPRLGSINLHASRLPRYRGAAPINWAIIDGETVTGNSVIRLARRMDAGAVLAQSRVLIGDLETAGELHDRLALDGAPLVLEVLDALAAGRAVEAPQDEGLATLAPKLSRESTLLDWSRPAAELARRIRGLYPWPGCRVRLMDPSGRETGRLRLVRARPSAAPPDRAAVPQPGHVTAAGSIATGEGELELIECHPDGGRPMPLADYRRGHAWVGGMHLESVV